MPVLSCFSDFVSEVSVIDLFIYLFLFLFYFCSLKSATLPVQVSFFFVRATPLISVIRHKTAA